MKYDGIKNYTLDIDATGIEAEKRTDTMIYIKDLKPLCPS
jgi:hypothetical protein